MRFHKVPGEFMLHMYGYFGDDGTFHYDRFGYVFRVMFNSTLNEWIITEIEEGDEI